MFDNIETYFEKLLELPKSEKKTKWEKVFLDMSVHTRKRVPSELLLKRRPNEEENIYKYRLENYEAITYGSMSKALNDLYRIVSGISYSTNVPENVTEYLNSYSIEQYCSSSHNETLTPKLFIEKIALQRDIEDPNGFLIWVPAGEGLEDSGEKVKPTPKLVLSSDYYYSDEFVFIYKESEVYYFLTQTEYWKMYQVEGDKWVQELIYTHNLQAFPVIVLGGDINAEKYYESYFAPYLAFGNEAIRQYSDWQAIMTTSSFPIKETFVTECAVLPVDKNNNPGNLDENHSGGGNGEVRLVPLRTGPYNNILRPIPAKANMMDDNLPVEIPSVRFISPDIEIAKYSGESWEKLIERAERALNIDVTVGLDQSGEAKKVDKESQYAMITKIGSNFYDNIYLNSLKFIDGYLNRKPFEKSQVTITKPSTFWVKTEEELVAEISQLKTNNAPSFFMAEATTDLAKKRFNGSPVKQRIFDFISLYDPYFIYTQGEKNNMIANGSLSKQDNIRSLRMFPILNQIAQEKADKFIQMSFEEINKEFESRVEQYFPEEESIELDDNGLPK